MDGPAKVNIETDKIKAAVDDALLEGMNASFLSLSRLIRGKLSQAGTGRVYRVAKGKKTGRNLRARGFHRASAPGYPPAVDTNRLRASWMVDLGRWRYGYALIEKKQNRTVLRYGSSVVYAPVMEYGSRSGKIKPRPYLRPSVAVFKNHVERLFAVAFQRNFGGK